MSQKTFELLDPDLKTLDLRKLLKEDGCMKKVKMKTKLERLRTIYGCSVVRGTPKLRRPVRHFARQVRKLFSRSGLRSLGVGPWHDEGETVRPSSVKSPRLASST